MTSVVRKRQRPGGRRERVVAGVLGAILGVATGACSDTVDVTNQLPSLGRSYRLITREDHDRSVPATVLLLLHAYATRDDVLVERYRLPQRVVVERGWVLVVARGTTDADGRPFWNATAACCARGRQRPDDVRYLRAVLDDVGKRLRVDESRVFALGVSNGGFMAHRLACEPTGRLTAFVSISGAAPGSADPPCRPGRPVSMLEVHGDRDQVVGYEGGTMNARHPSARSSARLWCGVAGCEPGVVAERRVRDDLFEHLTRIERWKGPASRVALWTVQGGSHELLERRAGLEAMLQFLDHSGSSRP